MRKNIIFNVFLTQSLFSSLFPSFQLPVEYPPPTSLSHNLLLQTILNILYKLEVRFLVDWSLIKYS